MNRIYILLISACVLIGQNVLAQTGATDIRVEPANWWVGMRTKEVEILFRKEALGDFTLKLAPSKGVSLVKVEKGDSPNYLFATIRISPGTPAQTLRFVFEKGSARFEHAYPLLARDQNARAQGVNYKDILYLIFPDRFANGNPANDNVAGMLEGLQRDSLTGRHGGDLKGIRDHLDYVKDLGMTAIWLNPELENDQRQASYHGYAVTDHYRIDRRFGTNEEYRELVQQCHKMGLKVVRDVVLNHIGDQHYWMKDLPFKDWVNVWPAFQRTNYRAAALMDPYASDFDKKLFNNGWFDLAMPDLNQRNPHVARYLIQQAIWWVEYAGIDDLRIDTYTYSDQTFCSAWSKALREEYPNMVLYGEIWEYAVPLQGFFAANQPMKRANFNSNLPGVIDFNVCFAIREMLTQEQKWNEGAGKVYYTLAQDYFYEDPLRNMIMLDNHDMTRIYSHIGEDLGKFKCGMALLLTLRGVPQIYYATEILDTGFEAPSHGNIRKDFPGGWPGDKADKFKATGRTTTENEAFNYVRTLSRYRNQTPALQNGKLMQFVPENGVYVYFRYDAGKTVMVAVNSSAKATQLDMKRFAERTKGYRKAREVVSGMVWESLDKIDLPAHTPLVLELQ
ncbi:MAG: glycoside hydrolase family 13 protein [Chitinophagales bacterium]|nr:glycoside hydrolase family 13 protein [Chitinophagales bacterium]